MKFEIVTDSSADLPEEYCEKVKINVVSFYVSLDSETYLKEGKEVSIPEFYQAMIDRSDCYPKTACPSIQDYMDAFLPIVKDKKAVLCCCLTQKFSGSYQSAMNAKEAILEEFPDAQIHVCDTELITVLQGIFVAEAVRLRDLNLSLEEAVSHLESVRNSGHIFFTTKDLKYLEHGGRLGKVASMAGSFLNLKPILHFYDGNLGTTQVCRGRKQSLSKVIQNFVTYIEEEKIDLKDYYFGTGIGVEIAEYEEFQKELKEALEKIGQKPDNWIKAQIGATVGVHTGPYPMGLGILKKCDI